MVITVQEATSVQNGCVFRAQVKTLELEEAALTQLRRAPVGRVQLSGSDFHQSHHSFTDDLQDFFQVSIFIHDLHILKGFFKKIVIL